MKDENFILIGAGAALIAYFIYQKWKNTIPEREDVTITKSVLSQNSQLLTAGNTTYKFREGDWSKLTLLQRFLYGIGANPNNIFQ